MRRVNKKGLKTAAITGTSAALVLGARVGVKAYQTSSVMGKNAGHMTKAMLRTGRTSTLGGGSRAIAGPVTAMYSKATLPLLGSVKSVSTTRLGFALKTGAKAFGLRAPILAVAGMGLVAAYSMFKNRKKKER